jgi:hypothetical protein
VLGALTDREREVLSLRTERTVEHRVRGVPMKLDLPESQDADRRVLAVIAHLRAAAHRGMRSFDVPPTPATHVRMRVVANQCTGAPDYAGEQDQDPRARTDCRTASPQALNVRAAELQVFER